MQFVSGPMSLNGTGLALTGVGRALCNLLGGSGILNRFTFQAVIDIILNLSEYLYGRYE
jgi:hypothetical protein